MLSQQTSVSQNDVHVRRGGGQQSGNRTGRQRVVRIHEAHPLRPGGFHPGSPCGRPPTVLLVHHLHTVILCRPLVAKYATAVTAPVVHKHYLQPGTVLPHHAGDALSQCGFGIEHRNHHGHGQTSARISLYSFPFFISSCIYKNGRACPTRPYNSFSFCSFPLDGRRRLGGDVVAYAVHLLPY